MSPTTRLLAAQILLVLGLMACGNDADETAEEAVGTPSSTTTAPDEGGEADDGSGVVEIGDFRFQPAEITVAAGTTVLWENHDDATHSVADRALDVESEDLTRGDTFERTFDEAGAFPYVCGIHNYMEGTVIVEERPDLPG